MKKQSLVTSFATAGGLVLAGIACNMAVQYKLEQAALHGKICADSYWMVVMQETLQLKLRQADGEPSRDPKIIEDVITKADAREAACMQRTYFIPAIKF